MATGPEALRTNPSMAPLFHWAWVAFQAWLGRLGSWQVLAMWKARSGLPAPSGLALVGRPSGPRVKPSPRPSIPR